MKYSAPGISAVVVIANNSSSFVNRTLDVQQKFDDDWQNFSSVNIKLRRRHSVSDSMLTSQRFVFDIFVRNCICEPTSRCQRQVAQMGIAMLM